MSNSLTFHLLAICGAGSFAGAMLLIGVVFGPYWTSMAPAEFLAWFSANSHFIGRSIPLFAAPTVVGIAGSLWLSRRDPSALWWSVALACVGAVFVITVMYHLPLNARFAARTVPSDQVATLLSGWLWWHSARVVLGFGAAIAGLLAAAPVGTRAPSLAAEVQTRSA